MNVLILFFSEKGDCFVIYPVFCNKNVVRFTIEPMVYIFSIWV